MKSYFINDAGIVVGECVEETPSNPDNLRIIKSNENIEIGYSKFTNGELTDLDVSEIYSKYGFYETLYRKFIENACLQASAYNLSNKPRLGLSTSVVSYKNITLGVMVDMVESTEYGISTYSLNKLFSDARDRGVHVYGEVYNRRFVEVLQKFGVDFYNLSDEGFLAWYNPDKYSELSMRTRIVDILSDYLQKFIDSHVASYGYDNISTVTMRTGYNNKFRDECIRLSVWADECWCKWFELLNPMSIEDLKNLNPNTVLSKMPIYQGD